MTDTNEIQPPAKHSLFLTFVAASVIGTLGVGLQIFSGVATEVPTWNSNLPPVNAGISILVALLALLLFAKPSWYGADPRTMKHIGLIFAIYGFAQACGAMAVVFASN